MAKIFKKLNDWLIRAGENIKVLKFVNDLLAKDGRFRLERVSFVAILIIMLIRFYQAGIDIPSNWLWLLNALLIYGSISKIPESGLLDKLLNLKKGNNGSENDQGR